MKRRTAGQSAILTLLILAAVIACAAVIYLRFENDSTVRPAEPPGARGSDGVVSGGTVTNPLPTDAAPSPTAGVKPVAPPSNAQNPAAVVPPGDAQFPYSYLAGRTPSEVRPDGTQVFKDVPFYVTQPDGSKVTTLTTITIQPAPVLPVKDESAEKR